MLSQPVINQLIAIQVAGVAVFNRVSGAANFAAAHEDLKNWITAAYVIPLADVAKPNDLMGLNVEQHVIERFGVILAVKNFRDQRGDAINIALETARSKVIQALMGFSPGVGYDPVQYGGGRILQLDVITTWWQLEFITGYYERNF